MAGEDILVTQLIQVGTKHIMQITLNYFLPLKQKQADKRHVSSQKIVLLLWTLSLFDLSPFIFFEDLRSPSENNDFQIEFPD